MIRDNVRTLQNNTNVKEVPCYPEAQFRVPDWGDKVDYGVGMSYRPVRLHWLASWYDNHRLLTPSPP